MNDWDHLLDSGYTVWDSDSGDPLGTPTNALRDASFACPPEGHVKAVRLPTGLWDIAEQDDPAPRTVYVE